MLEGEVQLLNVVDDSMKSLKRFGEDTGRVERMEPFSNMLKYDDIGFVLDRRNTVTKAQIDGTVAPIATQTFLRGNTLTVRYIHVASQRCWQIWGQ